MITMQKLNVVKVVATEDAAQKLEAKGFARAETTDSRKPYTEPTIEAVDGGITPDTYVGEEAPEVVPENTLHIVSTENKAPDGVPEDVPPINLAEEVEQNDTGADRPHRGNGKK